MKGFQETSPGSINLSLSYAKGKILTALALYSKDDPRSLPVARLVLRENEMEEC